jgi:hypothetical protein
VQRLRVVVALHQQFGRARDFSLDLLPQSQSLYLLV